MPYGLLLLAALGPFVFGSGGGSTTDPEGRRLAATFGQPIVGMARADTTLLRTGFWSRPAEETTPVDLLEFRAAWSSAGVQLVWRIAGDPIDHAGFHVYRRSNKGDELRLTDRLLAGGPDFAWIDRTPPRGTVDYRIAEVSRQGHLTWYGPISLVIDGPVPALAMPQNLPNPFRGTTTLRFQTPREGAVRLQLFDMAGRAVSVLVDEPLPAGFYEATWNGRTADGRRAAAGVYIAHLETTAGRRSLKLTLLP